MTYFFDTTALVKCYHREVGSEIVIKILQEKDSQIIVANLSLAEFISAFNRIKNRGEITPVDFQTILQKFSEDIFLRKIGVVEITTANIIQSYELILSYNLSSSDAVILATALEFKEFDPIFVCADIRSGLLSAAQRCHLSTLNPLSS